MIREFALPDLGEGLTESEVVAWKIAIGDVVALNDVIAEVETAKAIVELPSPFAGRIVALHADEGETLAVGAPLFSIALEGADHEGETPPAGTESAAPNLVGYGARAESSTPRRRHRAPHASSAQVSSVPRQEALPVPVAPLATTRPRSTPPVRKFARDLGVDLTVIAGTGDRGSITREDVQRSVDAATPRRAPGAAGGLPVEIAPAPGSGPASLGFGRETRTPIRGVRKRTAAAMVASAFTAPHVTEFLTIDVTAMTKLIAQLKADHAFSEHRITMLSVVARAMSIALVRNPTLNSRWDAESDEIVQFEYVNLGIAVATDRGLVVPNIKGADRLSFIDLADAIVGLTATARAGRATPADLVGGTISITNIGVFGIDAGTPILNPGEAAILAVGATTKRPWEHHGKVRLRDVMTLSLSFDHRLVDGKQGALFLADLGTILRDPGRTLTLV